MDQKLYIQSYCHIKNGEIALNGESLFKDASISFKDFIKSAYKQFKIDHSKFFKMDNLSKLAFISADILLNNEPEKNIALILSNRASSLDTDRKHQNAIENGFASPAVFVYTLPNICMGEISIRHQLYSENGFFVFDHFTPEILFEYSENLIAEQKANKALCGWVEFDNGKYEAFLYIVANKGTFVHSTSEINRLY